MNLTVFGIDGASSNIFGRWLEDLPNLRAAIDDGYTGNLKSTDPPLTNVAWTSFFTGKGPGKTGMYDWNYLTQSYGVEPYRGHEVREKTLYDIVPGSTHVNVPAAYPRIATAEDTQLVHSFDAPSKEASFPESFKSYAEYDEYVVQKKIVSSDQQPLEKIAGLRDIAAARFEFGKRVFEETEELFFLMFSETDWGLHIIDHLSGDIEAEYRGLYEDLDEYLGWFQERSDNIVLVSDHGFERKTRRFYFGEWLEQNGYLTRASGGESNGTETNSSGPSKLTQLVLKNDALFGIAKRMYKLVQRPLGLTSPGEQYDEMLNNEIDFDHTAAFKDGGLWNLPINRSSYYEQGSVSDNEFEGLRADLVKDLRGARDPKTGEPVFEYVRAATDVYNSTNPKAPDIVVNPNEGVTMANFSIRRTPFENTAVYSHRMDGFYTLVGEEFVDGEKNADIIDLMPTILHALGREVPEDVDGRVLIDAFVDDRSVKTGEPAVLSEEPPTRAAIEESDDEILQERLEDLGYM